MYASSEGLSTVLIEGGAIGGQAGSTSLIRNYLGFPRGVPGAKLAFSAYHQAWTFGTSFVFMRGARVLIVGGGNSAGQAAVHVAHYASEVTVLVRQPTLAASMSDYLVRALDAAPNIRVRFETAVLDASGDRRLERVTVRDRRSGVSEELDADALFLLIGSRPRTDWLTGVARDDWGFVLTGNDVTSLPEPVWPLERPPFAYEASIPGVFAVGDVRRGSVKRVASSVGEGSVVVSMIHEQRSLAGEVLVHSS